jgi:hypothetical protein
MQFTSSTAQSVLLFAATVLPVVHGAIAIGNQIRDGGTHYNVAWTEGLSPCSSDVAIAPESARLCNQNFHIDGTEYYLVGCTDPGTPYAQNPQRLRRVKDDSLYGTCSPVSKKTIDCSGTVHDVVKRYLCG